MNMAKKKKKTRKVNIKHGLRLDAKPTIIIGEKSIKQNRSKIKQKLKQQEEDI